jgi:hypothetical protein
MRLLVDVKPMYADGTVGDDEGEEREIALLAGPAYFPHNATELGEFLIGKTALIGRVRDGVACDALDVTVTVGE